MTPTPTPSAKETIMIDGKEIDLSTATREDLIHYLHVYVASWQKTKQDFFNAQRWFGIAIKHLGGELTADIHEATEMDGAEIERTEHLNQVTFTLLP